MIRILKKKRVVEKLLTDLFNYMYYMPFFWWQYERPSLTMKLVFLIVIIIISLTDGRYSKTWTQVDLDDTDPQIKPSKFSFNWIWEIFKLDFIFFIHAVQKVTTGEIPAFYEEIIQERRNKLAMQKFRNILLVSFVCWPIGMNSIILKTYIFPGETRVEVEWKNWHKWK